MRERSDATETAASARGRLRRMPVAQPLALASAPAVRGLALSRPLALARLRQRPAWTCLPGLAPVAFAVESLRDHLLEVRHGHVLSLRSPSRWSRCGVCDFMSVAAVCHRSLRSPSRWSRCGTDEVAEVGGAASSLRSPSRWSRCGDPAAPLIQRNETSLRSPSRWSRCGSSRSMNASSFHLAPVAFAVESLRVAHLRPEISPRRPLRSPSRWSRCGLVSASISAISSPRSGRLRGGVVAGEPESRPAGCSGSFRSGRLRGGVVAGRRQPLPPTGRGGLAPVAFAVESLLVLPSDLLCDRPVRPSETAIAAPPVWRLRMVPIADSARLLALARRLA